MDPGMVSMCLRELIPKTHLRIHSAAQEERRPKALVQSGRATPPSIPPGGVRTVAPSRAVSEPKKTRRRFNAPKHTPGTVKDYSRHIFIIVGGT